MQPLDEIIAKARRLLAECDGVWKEAPAIELASLMLRDGGSILDAAERETREPAGLGTSQEYPPRKRAMQLDELRRRQREAISRGLVEDIETKLQPPAPAPGLHWEYCLECHRYRLSRRAHICPECLAAKSREPRSIPNAPEEEARSFP